MKNIHQIQKLLDFISFTHKYQQVKRAILATGEDRDESDAEHSYQLAMAAWYLISTRNLKLDIGKVIKYALTHDLVEVYAGDTPFHSKDKTLHDTKQQREADALKKIKQKFQEFPEISELITAYEEKKDEEAKFVYALDKILPVVNIYLDGGKTWQKDNITYKMIRKKDEKIQVSPDAQNLWSQLISLLEENINLFP